MEDRRIYDSPGDDDDDYDENYVQVETQEIDSPNPVDQ